MKVLFVCTGNIYRSAAAKVLAERERDVRGIDEGVLQFASAGLGRTARKGLPMARGMRTTLYELYGIKVSLDSHRSVFLTEDMLYSADHVVVMAPVHERGLKRFPGRWPPTGKANVVRAWEFSPEFALQGRVPDPNGKGYDTLLHVARHLDEVVDHLIDRWEPDIR